MTAFVWPAPQGFLDILAEYFAEEGGELKVRVPEDFTAGIDHGRLAEGYQENATPFHLAALIFEGVATHRSSVASA